MSCKDGCPCKPCEARALHGPIYQYQNWRALSGAPVYHYQNWRALEGRGLGDMPDLGDIGIDPNSIAQGAAQIAKSKDSCKPTELEKVLIGVALSVLTAETGYPFVVLQAGVGLILQCPAARAQMATSLASCVSGFKNGIVDRFLMICPDSGPCPAYYPGKSMYSSPVQPDVKSSSPQADQRRQDFFKIFSELLTCNLTPKQALMEAQFEIISIVQSAGSVPTSQILASLQIAKGAISGSLDGHKYPPENYFPSLRVPTIFDDTPEAPVVLAIVQQCMQGIAYTAAQAADPSLVAGIAPPPSFSIKPASSMKKGAAVSSTDLLPKLALAGGASLLLYSLLGGDSRG